MARRCLVVSYYFPPVGGGGVQRITKLIKYLSRMDWQFTVYCASAENERIPIDNSLLAEIPASVRVERLGSSLPGKGRHARLPLPNYLIRWLSAFLYMPDSRKKWANRVRDEIVQEANKQSYDVILISSPPFSLAYLAGFIQQSVNIPVVLDMRDHWTTYPFKIHPTPYHLWRDRKMELETIRMVKYGVSAYSSLLKYFQAKYDHFSIDRWRHIPNGYDEEDFAGLPEESENDDNFNLAFLGSFYSHINHPVFLFKAIKELNKSHPALAARFRFHHIGQSMIDLPKLTKKMGVEKFVEHHGYLPHRESLVLLNKMDAFFLTYDPVHPYSGNTIGGKVYEYLRLKKPLLVLSDEQSEAAELVIGTNAGKVVAPAATKTIADILYNWIRQKPVYAFKGVAAYRRDRQAKDYHDFLEFVIRDWQTVSSAG